jgi:hypothetical protein
VARCSQSPEHALPITFFGSTIATIILSGAAGSPTLYPCQLTSILSVIDSVLCPVDGILTFVRSVVRTAIWSITHTIPVFFTKILFFINTIGGILHSIMSSLNASVDTSRKDYRRFQLLSCFLGYAL